MSFFSFPRFVLIAVLVWLTSSASAATGTASLGQSAKLSVAASGTAPFSYQWFKNNLAISGATNSTYTIASITTADAGSYTASVSNSAGSTTSDVAVLMVNAANPPGPTNPPPVPPTAPTPNLQAGHLTNVSIRGFAGTGSQTLIVGFIVTGTGNLPVLIRGWGPALAAEHR